MIVLIVGGFGVGKDTIADLLIEESKKHHELQKFNKILSYTTRPPRYEGENTHIFCTKDEFMKFNDLIAYSVIDDHYYGARKSQFDASKINLYCVDEKGVADVLSSKINDFIVIIEVIRPKWLINLPKERMNRKRKFENYYYKIDYRIINDGGMEKLQASVIDCFDFLTRVVKKNLL